MNQTTIAKGHWLAAAPAASYKRMRAARCPAGITDAGRTNAEQWDLWRRFKAGLLKATAAYPGTSKHEKGNALDLPEPARAWVRKHGDDYGWIKDRVRNEPWHFEYDPSRDIFATPWTVTAYVLNGRSGPFKAIKVRRRKGYKVYGVRIVDGWLVTRFGTYYSLNFLAK
jgi:hypothetical protein